LTLILREKLSIEDVDKCLKALKFLDNMERTGENLPVPVNFQYNPKAMTAKTKK